MTCMASISWFIFMEPISAAKAEDDRPASSTAVMTTANSRKTEMPINSTANTWAPNCCSRSAPMKAITAPMKKLVAMTMGMASSPARST